MPGTVRRLFEFEPPARTVTGLPGAVPRVRGARRGGRARIWGRGRAAARRPTATGLRKRTGEAAAPASPASRRTTRVRPRDVARLAVQGRLAPTRTASGLSGPAAPRGTSEPGMPKMD